MKKLLSLALIGALSLSLTACGNNSSKDNSSSKETTTTKKEEKKEPLDLTGEWQCDPTDGTYLKATISNGVIEIDWVFVEENKSAIYWVGSYDAPTTDTNEYSWVSNNDHEQTETPISFAISFCFKFNDFRNSMSEAFPIKSLSFLTILFLI
jgi:predicted small lipoprotein YifL